ncbi:hypothetical protein CEUSTIGMA_g12750.t1 [Chlamydomonas eustigma]|uniref:Protein kinase domain-containing protein n=1 Tax=Chlamydomonas eustigma TaxID=1157962 RepID=A0A250XQN2_9CHLO|nr:hypothetical protein CEUSTIGMA_g12750.t1 [Chlamydomonas eustigma]|eukprot:GAX85333.1 hypothetical protein CEUSTIGMA_g12750.t1 [Chlamydomonas eustigma]
MELENELMELKKVALQVICENEALKEGRGLLLQQVQNERTKAVMSPIHALPREQLSDLMWKTSKKLGKGGCAEVFELVDEVEDAASSMSFAFKKALPGCGFMIESEVVALQSARGPGVMAVESVVMCNEVLEGRSGRPEDMTPVGYTMEQMDGCLESLLRKKISPPQFIAVMARCATSLAQLHQAGYLHCDVKPGNLLYKGWPGSPSFQVKVSDLGHARPFEADKGHEGVAGPTLGTAYIQAPECFTEARVCSKADVWSVGIMMYVYLSQRYPYMTKSNRYLDQDRTEMKIRRGSRPDVLQVSNISKVVGDWELDFPIAAVEMLDLMSSCLQEDPCHRPCMANLASSLSCLEQRCLLVPAAQLDVACRTASCLEDEVEEDHPLGMMVQDPLPQLPDSLGFCCCRSIPSSTPDHNTWQEAAVLDTSGTESIMAGEDPLGMMVQDPLPHLPDSLVSLGFSCYGSSKIHPPSLAMRTTYVSSTPASNMRGCDDGDGACCVSCSVVRHDIDLDPLPVLPDSLGF